MLVLPGFPFTLDVFSLLFLRFDEKVFQRAEITPVKEPHPLGVWMNLVIQVMVRTIEYLEPEHIGQPDLHGELTAYVAGRGV